MNAASRKPSTLWMPVRNHQRSIILVIVFAAAVYVMLGVCALYQQEIRLAGDIESNGGVVRYDYFGPAWIPITLRNRLKCFYCVYEVELKNVEQADVFCSKIRFLPHLRRLILQGTQATDGGVKHLKNRTNLEALDLNGTQVTDSGLGHLSGMDSLVWLNLGGTRITDAGLEHLNELKMLVRLELGDTRITDAGLEHLNEFKKLVWLELGGTRVTDDGLEHLKGMDSLKTLCLLGTNVTPDGCAKLQSALPHCRVIIDEGRWQGKTKVLGLFDVKSGGGGKGTGSSLTTQTSPDPFESAAPFDFNLTP